MVMWAEALGFLVFVTCAIHLTYGCGGYYYGSGSISSPNYPRNYDNNIHCRYTITQLSHDLTEIRFTSFSLEPCCDFVIIRMNNGTVLQYSGVSLPPTLRIYGPITVTFRSDGTIPRKGFFMRFRKVHVRKCPTQELDIRRQDFRSSNVADNYIYRIPGESHMTTFVQFASFNLLSCRSCYCESLTIYHGDVSGSGHMVAQFCGSDLPPPFSYNGPITIKLHTKRLLSSSNILIRYSIRACGGVFEDLEGEIKSPDHPGPVNCSECMYVIAGKKGSNTIVEFVEFLVGKEWDCYHSNLTIYYGNRKHIGQEVGTYCGSNRPPKIEYAGSVTIVLRSTESGPPNRFFLKYKILGCIKKYNNTTGLIKWTSNKGDNDSRVDCQFIIFRRSNHYTLVRFDNYHLNSDHNCDENSLRVYRGIGTQNSILVGTYCGDSIPKEINYKGPLTLRLYFKQQASTNMSFQANYTVYQCGRIFNESGHNRYGHPSHIIESPNFPNGYYSNLDCEYIINPSRRAGSQITVIEFKNFSLEYDLMCNKDSLTIYGKTTDGTTMLGKYCGRRLPPVIAHRGSVILRFRTSAAGNGPGFRIIYRFKDCGGTFNPNYVAQRITLVNQTSDYKNVDCVYRINKKQSTETMIRFLSLNLHDDASCRRDSLTIYGGPKTNQFNLIGKYCGKTLPPDSKYWGEMAVQFKTSKFFQSGGFDFIYLTCSQRFNVAFTQNYFYFSSPRYNGKYLNSLDCEYTFHGARSIVLATSSFSLENSTDCHKDNVTIYRGNSSASGFLVGTYCGSNRPPRLTSAEPITIRFRTDSSGVNSGFNMMYRGNDCGGLFQERAAIVEYASRINTLGYLSCEYVIAGSSKLVTVLKIMNMNFNYGCSYSKLTIFVGNNSQTGKEIGAYCGSNIPPLITHTGPITLLLKMFRVSSSYDSFKFQYKFQDCGGRYNDLSGTIKLNNYPDYLLPENGCEYFVTGGANMKTTIRITNMSLQNFQLMCRMKYLKFYSVETEKELISNCRYSQPVLITHHGPIKIRFNANGRMSHKVYTLQYEVAGCSGTYNGLSGDIKSPNNPHKYPNDLTCDYVIRDDSNRSITLQPIQFNLQKTYGCYADSLSIYRGYPKNDTLIGRYCGNKMPVIRKVRSPITIRFHSDKVITKAGFQLHYTVHTCDKVYSTRTGHISSPNYPNAYNASLDCEYTISKHDNLVTFINFTNFHLQECGDCSCDNLTIYQGYDSSSGRMVRTVCGSVAIPTMAFTGPITIRLQTNHLVEKFGFQLRYEVKACSAMYNAKRGVIMSPNHPLNYANNLNCTYYIKGKSTQATVLRFQEFKLLSFGSCGADSLAVYAGIGTNASNLIGRFCGNQLPKDIITYGPATLQLLTDGFEADRGFLVEYSIE